MTQFEFLMTFASVILAIALSEMLGGWGRLIRSRLPISWSGLWVGWSLLVIAFTIMYWSGMWPYRDQSFSEGYKVFWLAVPTFFLVVLGYLLSPEPEEDALEVDLGERYWLIAPRMFPLVAIFLVCSTLADVLIMGGRRGANPLQELGISLHLYGIVSLMLLVACSFIKKLWLHWGTLALLSAAPLLFLFGELAIFR
jgi:hypothetical protein